MFNKNSEHNQTTLFKGGAFGLNKLFKDARDSEEYFFYETIFSNIDEEIFKPLFCHNNGRPNAPINCMVSAPVHPVKSLWEIEDS